MSNYEATKYNFDGANLTDIEGIPTATIIPWSDSSVPTGFLECNGAAVSRSTYSAFSAPPVDAKALLLDFPTATLFCKSGNPKVDEPSPEP